MTLKAEFQALPEALMAGEFASLTKAATLRRVTPGTFASSGEVVNSTTTFSVRTILVDITRTQDRLPRVAEAEQKALVPAKRLSTVPRENDEFLVEGVVYLIVQVETDAAGALHTLYLRRP